MKKLLKSLVIAGFLLAPVAGFSQEADRGPDAGKPIDGGGGDVPIDGGLSLLLAAGVGYGAKKVYDKQKRGGAVTEI